MNISTRCDPRDFKKTVSKLSDIKAKAVDEMRLGFLRSINCTKLNRPMCQMLVDNFDPVNNEVRIHGKSFFITHTDFQRIMGVKDGGYVVELNGYIEEPDTMEFMMDFGGSKNEITVQLMKAIVLDRAEVDDTFRIGFFVYALAILLCPGTSHVVDPRYLLPLRNSKTIHLKNWASFSFDKLVEGLRSYKIDSSNYMSGCILFLQLFYYDIIPYGSKFIDKRIIPIVCWGNAEGERLLSWVEEHGGLHSPQVLVSSAQFRKLGGTSESHGTDFLTATEYRLYQRHASLQAQISLVKTHTGGLKSAVAQMACNFESLQDRVGKIHKSIVDSKEDIGKVIQFECSKDNTTVGICNTYKRFNASKDGSTWGAALKIKGSCNVSEIDDRTTKLCAQMGEFSVHDSEIMRFLFSTKHLQHNESRSLTYAVNICMTMFPAIGSSLPVLGKEPRTMLDKCHSSYGLIIL